jgi:hypothetical protein
MQKLGERYIYRIRQLRESQSQASYSFQTQTSIALIVACSELIWINFGNFATRILNSFSHFENSDPIELRDKGSVVLLIFLVSVFSLWPEKTLIIKNRNLARLLEYSSWMLIVCSVGSIDRYREDLPNIMWEGFGLQFTLSCIALTVSVLVFRTLDLQIPSKIGSLTAKSISVIQILLIGVLYLPSILNFPKAILSKGGSRYALNEILAPLAGLIPNSSFNSQYSAILGMPLLLIPKIYSSNQIPLIATGYINLLIALVFVFSAVILKKIFPRMKFLSCLFFSVTIPLVTIPNSMGPSSSIVASLTAIPGRTFLPISTLLFTILWIEKRTYIHAVISAVLTSLAFFNNFEFGITFAGSIFLFIIISVFTKSNIFSNKTIGLYYFFVVFTSTTYVGGLSIFGNGYDPRKHLLFTRSFAENFGGIPIPKFGLYIFIYTIYALSLILSIRQLRKLHGGIASDKSLVSAISVGVILGLWVCGSMFYYAGRSVNSGQLQFFLIPLPIVVAVFIRIYNDVSGSGSNARQFLFSAPVAILFLASMPFAALIQAPNPNVNFKRLTNTSNEWTVDSISTTEFGTSFKTFIGQQNSNDIGYYGLDGNLFSLAFDIKNLTTVNSPFDVWISPRIYITVCNDISKSGVGTFVAPQSEIPEHEIANFCSFSGVTFKQKSADGQLLIYEITQS